MDKEPMEQQVPQENIQGQPQEPQKDGPQGLQYSQQEKAYASGLVKMVHSKQTSREIVAMLKSAPPEQSVPQAALVINDNMENLVREQDNKPVPFKTAMKGMMLLIQELFAVGEAAGLFRMPENQGALIIEDTLSKYVHKGLKEKTIDPIEVQMYGESLMNDEQKAQGLQQAEAAGIPLKPGQEQAMEAYASMREQRALSKVTDKQAASNRQGMLQGGA